LNGTWRPSATDRVMLLAPHPDDEILAAGVLLSRSVAAGAAVRVVLATDGEANVWVQRLVERRIRVTAQARARFAAKRRSEAECALGGVGVPESEIVSLGLPDTGLTDVLLSGSPEPVDRIAAAVAAFEPTLLLVPSIADTHPDHSALGVLARLALDRRGGAAPRLLEYVVHGDSARLSPADVAIEPSPDERRAKCVAMLCHATPMAAHRREFFARAHDAERFRDPAPPGRTHGRHPIRAVSRDDRELVLDISSQPRLGAWGRRTLHLVGAENGAVTLRCRMALPSGSGESRLTDDAGGRELAVARVERRPLTSRVRLPAKELAPRERRFGKIERRHGFYDEGGWIELARGSDVAGADAVPIAAAPPAAVVCAVLPCFNVEAYCGPVLAETATRADFVIAVDDGSTDGTRAVLEAAARAAGPHVTVLALSPNRGKGVALLEAFRLALARHACTVVVTLDGDGQHRPADIATVVAEWQRGADLVIGGRGRFEEMPLRSRFGNTMTAAVLRRLYPRCPRDTQSGLRAHDRGLVEAVVEELSGRRYETELEILLLALSRGRRVTTVPIPAIYLDRNKSSHFRPLVDSARIYRALFAWKMRKGTTARPASPSAHDAARRSSGSA
jgi:LmbE family N-acetylglucosaminyl deacetylase